VGNGAAGEQACGDDRVLALRPLELLRGDDALPDPTLQLLDRPLRLRLQQIRPSWMIAIRVQSSDTSSTMCVERRTTLRSPSSLSRLRKRTRSAGSRPAVGSSTTSSLGSPSSASATPKRCCIPPDQVPSFMKPVQARGRLSAAAGIW
jgi:hypothetical protein